ncbi:hypothetical protein BK147_23425 [Paenibacillus sp. FSL R7-0337]|nr:hypothetical protein BK147_23425 [Paenibacillus sp. FSL R7-0337]
MQNYSILLYLIVFIQLADIKLDVKSFGAKGDWNRKTETDDTAALQLAIDNAIQTGTSLLLSRGN